MMLNYHIDLPQFNKTVEINHSDRVETANRSYESKLKDAPGVQIVNRLICDNHIR